MKKLLVVMLVLAMAGLANAAIELTSLGTEVVKNSSITFDVTATGTVEAPQGEYYLGITTDSVGDASFDITNGVIAFAGSPTSWWLSSDYSTDLGVRDNYVTMDIYSIALPPAIPPAVLGSIFTGIKLTGVTKGSITLRLFDNGLNTTDYTVNVKDIPEPITIGLLGLGGLFLRRRK